MTITKGEKIAIFGIVQKKKKVHKQGAKQTRISTEAEHVLGGQEFATKGTQPIQVKKKGGLRGGNKSIAEPDAKTGVKRGNHQGPSQTPNIGGQKPKYLGWEGKARGGRQGENERTQTTCG